MTDMQHIRDHYRVPARPGAPVTYHGAEDGLARPGKVVATNGVYVLICLDGEKTTRPYHPTWCLTWHEENGPASRVPTFEVRPAPTWLGAARLDEPQWSGV